MLACSSPRFSVALLIGAVAVAAAAATSADAQIVKPRTAGETLVRDPSSLPTRTKTPPPGPGPTIYEVKGQGIVASLSWGSVTGATTYLVTRSMPARPDCCVVTSESLTKTTWLDTTLLIPGDYNYRVYVNYSDGRQGFTDVAYTRPQPQDPTGFVATPAGAGAVKLTWNPVPGIPSYIVRGPGTLPNGTPVNGATSLTLMGLPLSRSQQHWTVASWYGRGGVLTDSSAWPKASVEVSAFGPLSATLFVERSLVALDLSFTTVREAVSFQLSQTDQNNQQIQPAFTVGSRAAIGSADQITLRLFPQLQPDRPYRFQVFAVMPDGSAYTGPTATVTVPFFQLRTTIPISNDRIILEWNTFGSPPYTVKKGNMVQQGGSSALVFEEIRDQSGNVMQFSGRRFDDLVIQHGVKYWYQVCATVPSGMMCPGTEITFP